MFKVLNIIRKNSKKLITTKNQKWILNPRFFFSYKDEAFWEEYTKRKAEGGRVPALESQEIILNKTVHSWKYSDKHSLSSQEFLCCLRDLDPKSESPYIIVDIREESELELYKLPLRTKVFHFYLE